jgi:hypothetical protein
MCREPIIEPTTTNANRNINRQQNQTNNIFTDLSLNSPVLQNLYNQLFANNPNIDSVTFDINLQSLRNLNTREEQNNGENPEVD